MISENPTLYIVALPIGHNEDITLRALNTLKSVDCIAAEDTRTFGQFASEMKIECGQVISYHDHNEESGSQSILDKLNSGKSVALVTDAGTPNISDPGFEAVRLVRKEGFKVTPIPGVSSLTTALSVSESSGPSPHPLFLGFPPKTESARKLNFQSVSSLPYRLIYFESPHRLLAHLKDSLDIFGNRKLEVFRELTKPFESYFNGTVSTALEHYKKNKPKGEFVLIYEGTPPQSLSKEDLKKLIGKRLSQQLSNKDILNELKELTSLTRSEIYNLIEQMKSR